MREINCDHITDAVKRIYIKAAVFLPPDIAIQLECAWESETSETGQGILADLVSSFNKAASSGSPICDDTGMAVVFADIGQDVHISGGSFEDAVNEGVRLGYGFLKKSHLNTETPAVIHMRLVPGDKLKITVAPIAIDSENVHAKKIFQPSVKREEIEDFIVETVSKQGLNSSAPWILGVGLGGTVEKCAVLAKQALYRPIDVRNSSYEDMERSVLNKINSLGIGPKGLGGMTSALAVNIEVFAGNIIGLPCIVNMGCHLTRRATAIL